MKRKIRRRKLLTVVLSAALALSNVSLVQAEETALNTTGERVDTYAESTSDSNINGSEYYDVWWDFEDTIWTNTAIGESIIGEGGTSSAALEQVTDTDENKFMKIDATGKGTYRVSKQSVSDVAAASAEVVFDWKPMSIQDSNSRFGDVAFYTTDNTYAYFGLQFDKNMQIKYYTVGENIAKGWAVTYSEEKLEGGIVRNSAVDSGTAKDTGITADGNTWYTVKLNFNYDAHTAALTISNRDSGTILFTEENIAIYNSAINVSFISVGGWKGKSTMGLDNMGVKYSYAQTTDIVSITMPENVMILPDDLQAHLAARPTSVKATLGDGSTVELQLGEWASTPAFSDTSYTEYTWTADLIIPDGYQNPKNLKASYVMNYLKNYIVSGAYDPQTLELEYGTVTKEEFAKLFPTETQVVLNNGTIAKAELDADSWEATVTSLQDGLSDDLYGATPKEFDPVQEGIYVYKVKLETEGTFIVEEDTYVEWRVNYFSYDDNFNGYTRSTESLQRGLYAVRNLVYDSQTGDYAESAEGGNYLSWRILVDEYEQVQNGSNITFELYRNNEKIATLTNETDYLDVDGAVGDKYVVKAIQNGIYSYSKEVEALEENYISVELQRPLPNYSASDSMAMYRLNDTEVADVDGDGEYELIVKWYPNNGFDPGKASSGSTASPHFIDVYEMDGTALWRLNMGYSSPSSQHFDNYIVYDMDEDGKAEFAILTQDGTRTYRPDENGKFAYVTTTEGGYEFVPTDAGSSESLGNYELSADGNGYVLSNAEGYNFAYVGEMGSPMLDDAYLIDVVGDITLEGATIQDNGFKSVDTNEYFTVFNGATGEIIDTVDYAYDTRFFMEETENNNEHLVHRFNIAVGYIPSDVGNVDCTEAVPAIWCNRAYYADVSMITYTLVDGKIHEAWRIYIPTADEGGGNHNMITGDIDNDGFDELYLGATVIDHDGTVLWAKNGKNNMDYMKHGDMIHMTAVYPDNDQLYVFTPVEDKSVSTRLNYALSNGATGARVVGHTFGQADTGRGMLANITSKAGYEIWTSTSGTDENGKLSTALYNVYGEVVSINRPTVQNWFAYWDGDLLSELPNTEPANGADKSGLPMGVHKYNEETEETETIATFVGTWSNNSTKNNPCLTADILGDWREEILVRETDNETLRIYMTNIPTDYTIYTLMHDSVYRNAVAAENNCYNVPPHTSFYLGEDEIGRNRVLNFALPVYEYEYTQNNVTKYTDVSFMANNGAGAIVVSDVKLGDKVTTPENVVKAGYELEGWYLDEALTQKWNMETDVVNTGGIVLYANWVVSQNPGPAPTTTPAPTATPVPTVTPAPVTQEVQDGVTYKVSGSGATISEIAKDATSVTIPSTITTSDGQVHKVTSIAKDAARGNTKLKSVVINDNITSIGDYAFYGCTGLKSVKIGKNVVTIGKCAFGKNTSLTAIVIPDKVRTIGVNAFDSCTGLKTAKLGKSLTTISDKMFYKCKSLTKVTIPSKVTKIGKSAFANCTKLSSVTIGKKVSTISSNAFYKCTALKKVTIPASVKTIGGSAFAGCTKLTTLTIGNKVSKIDKNAFSKCTALKKVTIPVSVKSIGANAFNGCKNLKNITIKTTKLTTKNVGKNAFKGINSKATIKVPKSKLKAYQTLLKTKGIGKNVVIK